MRNRPAAFPRAFAAAVPPATGIIADFQDQQCGTAAGEIPVLPVSISLKRRDTRSATVVGDPIFWQVWFWQVWRPKRAVYAVAWKGTYPGGYEKAALGCLKDCDARGSAPPRLTGM